MEKMRGFLKKNLAGFYSAFIFALHLAIELWCNGSTTDFGSVCLGSNPSSSTKKPVISTGFSFLYLFINVLTLAFLQFPPISGTVPVF